MSPAVALARPVPAPAPKDTRFLDTLFSSIFEIYLAGRQQFSQRPDDGANKGSRDDAHHCPPEAPEGHPERS